MYKTESQWGMYSINNQLLLWPGYIKKQIKLTKKCIALSKMFICTAGIQNMWNTVLIGRGTFSQKIATEDN